MQATDDCCVLLLEIVTDSLQMTSSEDTTSTSSTLATAIAGSSGTSSTRPTGGTEISSAQFDQLLRQLDQKFLELRKEVQEDQRDAVQKVAKRAKLDRPHKFRFAGNEDQFLFNERLEDCLDEVGGELEKASSAGVPSSKSSEALKKAAAAVREGSQLLELRQKHIKLADRSEHGWKVVKEYETDDLARDSDDEKRIIRAEKAAEKKVVSLKKKSRGGKTPARTQTWLSYRQQSFPQSQRPQYPRYAPSTSGAAPSRPVGPCHACHEFGHLRNSCPKVFGTPARNPQYPFHMDSVKDAFISMGSSAELVKEYQSVGVNDDGKVNESMGVDDDGLSYRYWEQEIQAKSVSVKGRLKQCYEFWAKELQASQPVLDIVQEGYSLPLMHLPEPYASPNHSSALCNESFVDEALSELLHSGCVKLAVSKPHICSPLLVVENSSGKKRLVINLKYLNLYLWKDKFKYEDMRAAMMYFEKGNFMCTFDLKSGYHHVDMHPKSQTYLGFEWKKSYYVFTVLPFGLATASGADPRLFKWSGDSKAWGCTSELAGYRSFSKNSAIQFR